MTGPGPSTARWSALRSSGNGAGDRTDTLASMAPSDLTRLEHQAVEHPEQLEFGPDYEMELEPAAHHVEGEWIRDATLGANDGLVSVLTLIAGVSGAADDPSTVLLAGVAGGGGGGISRAGGAAASAQAPPASFPG